MNQQEKQLLEVLVQQKFDEKNRKTIFQSDIPTKVKRFQSDFDGRVKPGFIEQQEFDYRYNSKL